MTAPNESPDDAPAMTRPVVLIGLMGAGKTSVGRRLADRLGLSFMDSDQEIEEAAGCTIADIFETYGETAFRDVERRVIQRLLSGDPLVLATGGGAFMDAETRAQIKQDALTVWLRADLDTLIERTAGRYHRPLLNAGDPRTILQNLIDTRYPVYAEADVVVDSQREPLAQTVSRVLRALTPSQR